VYLQLPTPLVFIGCLLSDPIYLPKRRIICGPVFEQIHTYSQQSVLQKAYYKHLYSPNKAAMYINEQINKPKRTSKKETIAYNRPIHIPHCSHNQLGLCRKHFAIITPVGTHTTFFTTISHTYFNIPKKRTYFV